MKCQVCGENLVGTPETPTTGTLLCNGCNHWLKRERTDEPQPCKICGKPVPFLKQYQISPTDRPYCGNCFVDKSDSHPAAEPAKTKFSMSEMVINRNPEIKFLGSIKVNDGVQFCSRQGNTDGFKIGIVVAVDPMLKKVTVLGINWNGVTNVSEMDFSTPCFKHKITIQEINLA
jgi:hypothetical protein